MDEGGEFDWRLQSDWYSPTRLHDSPVEFDFPGDRFIPNRSLMDLGQAQGELTNRTDTGLHKTQNEYRRHLENLTLDADGRPFQMLVFRGSPKLSRRTGRLIDKMRHSDEEKQDTDKPYTRRFPKKASHILDAPNLKDDYYLNIMEWGKTNSLAVALGEKIYLWNADNYNIELLPGIRENEYPASVSWSEDAKMLAVGYSSSRIQIFDAESLKPVRSLSGHGRRVGTLAWNGHVLTSGSCDRMIINHDVRARSAVSHVKEHKGEVCGLKWSNTGNMLASGGNDNVVYVWDACKMSSMRYIYRLSDHCAAVKALAWCPHDYNVLATGGGLNDGTLKIWNIQKGSCINSIDTKAQICGVQWNRHHKEILSGHGYGFEHRNQLCLWKYPAMSAIGESITHSSRILHLSQSPDGLTVVSAGEDETIRFWEAFGPAPKCKSNTSYLEGLLSLKTSQLR